METKRCANCHKLLRADSQVCSRCGYTFASTSASSAKKVRPLSKKLTMPSIPPASPHLAGHYSGLHPEDQPYQSSQMVAQYPDADTGERPQLQREPEQIVLPAPEPQTDPELHQPTVLMMNPPKWRSPDYVSLPSHVRERFSRASIGAPRFSSLALTLACLFLLLASSVLAFVLIGNRASIATAAFSASPSSVRPGDAFTLTGNGFKSASLLHFSLDSNQPVYDDAGNALTVRTNGGGAFLLQIHVPTSWSVGRHTIYASDPSQGVSISTAITVAPPTVSQPDLQVAKTSLTFPTMAAGTISNLPLILRNAGAGIVRWQASSDQPWLSVAPTSGSFSDSVSIQVAVNRSGLSSQSYSAHLVLVQQGSPTRSLRVTVTMAVSPAPATLTPLPATLSFASSTTQNPLAQSLVIQNSGGQPLDWASNVAQSSSSWLSVSPTEGHLDPGASATLVVSASTLQLPIGSYQGTIGFTGDADVQVAVSLDVQASGNLQLSPSSLTTNIQSNQPATTRTVTLQNTGGQPLDWTASATTADGGKWLSVTPVSGTLNPGEQTTLTVNVQSGLPAGTYHGTVNFASQGQTTRQLAISCAVTTSSIQMQADALHFTAQKGANPAAQTLSMTNTSNTALNWTAKLDDTTTPAFLSVSPLSGTIAPGQKISLTVSANIANAPVGTLSGGIDIVNSNDASVVLADEVSVDVVISDAAPPLTATPTTLSLKQVGSVSPQVQTLTISNTATTVSHWSLVQPLDTAQSWLIVSQASGTLKAGANVPISVSSIGSKLAVGTYTATLRLFNTDVSTSTPVQTFTVTLTVS
jgi:Viral BACON domain